MKTAGRKCSTVISWRWSTMLGFIVMSGKSLLRATTSLDIYDLRWAHLWWLTCCHSTRQMALTSIKCWLYHSLPLIQVGDGSVIQGLDEGVIGTCIGEGRRIIIPPEAGFGTTGSLDGSVPPNTTVIYDVQVMTIFLTCPPCSSTYIIKKTPDLSRYSLVFRSAGWDKIR